MGALTLSPNTTMQYTFIDRSSDGSRIAALTRTGKIHLFRDITFEHVASLSLPPETVYHGPDGESQSPMTARFAFFGENGGFLSVLACGETSGNWGWIGFRGEEIP